MFEDLSTLAADPLLGIITRYRADTNPNKIDLGVGVYKDTQGLTPVLSCVKQAEAFLLENEDTKDYVGQLGNIEYGQQMARLVFGEHLPSIADRLAHIQTPGGCGALRLLAELITRTSSATPSLTVWLSDPTWVNHVPLIGGAGLELKTYPYYNFERGGLRFDEMLAALQQAKQGDVLVLHGCCHNPSGADLSSEQWAAIIELCAAKGLIPLIDIAYQGLADSLDDDAHGVRLAAQALPEVLVSVSCSKNFAMYRERVGSAFVLTQSPERKLAAESHLAAIARGIYSMPPSHGAMVVEKILSDATLSALWQSELAEMRERLQSVRSSLVSELQKAFDSDRFDFIVRDKGLFSFMGISESQVNALAQQHSIYMAGSSRINLAGFNEANISYFVGALQRIL